MSDELNEELDSQSQSVAETEETQTVETETPVEEVEDVEALKEKNRKLFERAKKAEAEAKALKAKAEPKPAPQVKSEFDLEDVVVLTSRVADKGDREFVKKTAKILGVTLEEALNDDIVISKLKKMEEQRKTANATNVTGSRRTSPQVTDEAIIESAKQGKSFDPDKLAEARMNLRLKNAQK